MDRDKLIIHEEMHDGNQFFEHRYPSIQINIDIERMNSFDEFERYFTTDLMDENLLMGRYLYHLLDRHETNPGRISKAIGKHESYVRKIVNGDELNPSRDVLLALCVVMGATVEETQILLRYSGKQPLYARRKRDAIIWFALKKRSKERHPDGQKYLEDLNEYLESCDDKYKSLTKIITKKEKNENTIRCI